LRSSAFVSIETATTARSRAGTLTTVARTVIAQSSAFALPSATCERSL
jgi:hypothetical protein